MARHHPQIFASVDVPLTLVLLFAQMTLFVGLASRDMTDDDREWWGRAAAWVLMVGGGLARRRHARDLRAGPAVARPSRRRVSPKTAGRLWLGLLTLVTGGAASRLGSSWTRVSTPTQWVERWLFVLAAPLLVLLLTLLLATADLRLLEFFHDLDLFNELTKHPIGASLPEDLMALGLLLLLGAILSRLISVNDFSLHGMYRKRLARTFLGTSRAPEARHPNPFTGFDDEDDLPIARDRGSRATAARRQRDAEPGRADDAGHAGAALGVVHDDARCIADRRGASVTARRMPTPAASRSPSAITLSGAAVSPNMGAASKPALTFLLTLFNARLGAWLANPGPAGDGVWLRPRLSYGAAPLLNELMGSTTDTNPYVYLSDGGHFENLGLYEMVLRRCRFDRRVGRRLRSRLPLRRSRQRDPKGTPRLRRRHRVPGRTRHDRVGRRAAAPAARSGGSGTRPPTRSRRDGVLLYVKAALCGDEPVDVANYAAANPPFPHQPTRTSGSTRRSSRATACSALHTWRSSPAGRRVHSVAELCATAGARQAAVVPETVLCRKGRCRRQRRPGADAPLSADSSSSVSGFDQVARAVPLGEPAVDRRQQRPRLVDARSVRAAAARARSQRAARAARAPCVRAKSSASPKLRSAADLVALPAAAARRAAGAARRRSSARGRAPPPRNPSSTTRSPSSGRSALSRASARWARNVGRSSPACMPFLHGQAVAQLRDTLVDASEIGETQGPGSSGPTRLPARARIRGRRRSSRRRGTRLRPPRRAAGECSRRARRRTRC